jgi:hypothetical protein
MQIPPQTEIEKLRAAWWAEHFKARMAVADAIRLNSELLTLFPKTLEERNWKAKEWSGMPEFAL